MGALLFSSSSLHGWTWSCFLDIICALISKPDQYNRAPLLKTLGTLKPHNSTSRSSSLQQTLSPCCVSSSRHYFIVTFSVGLYFVFHVRCFSSAFLQGFIAIIIFHHLPSAIYVALEKNTSFQLALCLVRFSHIGQQAEGFKFSISFFAFCQKTNRCCFSHITINDTALQAILWSSNLQGSSVLFDVYLLLLFYLRQSPVHLSSQKENDVYASFVLKSSSGNVDPYMAETQCL